MRFLLDTHVFIAALGGTLPPKLERRLLRSDSELLVSIVTPWEIALNSRLQKLGLKNDLIEDKIIEMGARLLQITLDHTAIVSQLPAFPDHRDPFDRMLIAQAIEDRCQLVSSDQQFPRYVACATTFGRLQLLWD